jgi:hypothetical protein
MLHDLAIVQRTTLSALSAVRRVWRAVDGTTNLGAAEQTVLALALVATDRILDPARTALVNNAVHLAGGIATCEQRLAPPLS